MTDTSKPVSTHAKTDLICPVNSLDYYKEFQIYVFTKNLLKNITVAPKVGDTLQQLELNFSIL